MSALPLFFPESDKAMERQRRNYASLGVSPKILFDTFAGEGGWMCLMAYLHLGRQGRAIPN